MTLADSFLVVRALALGRASFGFAKCFFPDRLRAGLRSDDVSPAHAASALPFKGSVGWGWCLCDVPSHIAALISSLAISARAGIQRLCSLKFKVQSFDSPAASRLLFGIAQKVGKKARHRTRWSDSHRANRTALCFSASRGRSDSTVPVLLRDRGDPSPRPFGLIPRILRCSAPRTAPVVPRTPSIHGLRRTSRLGRRASAFVSALAVASAAGCRPMGPLWRGEGAEEKSEGGRARDGRDAGGRAMQERFAGCAPVRCMYMDVHSANPAAASRTRSTGMCGERATGVCFFW